MPAAEERFLCQERRNLLRPPKSTVRRRRLRETDSDSQRLAETVSSQSPTEGNNIAMSKAFIAQVIQDSASLTGTASNRAAGDLMAAIVKELKKNGRFTLPSFGTFIVRKTKARKGLNPAPASRSR